MTFLELEKKCKQRRFFRRIKYFIFVLFLCGAGILGYYFFYKTSDTQKNKKTEFKTIIKKPEKNVKKNIKKEINKTIENKKTEKNRLKLIIDLNISEPKPEKSKQPKIVKKDKEKKPVMKTADQNNTALLQTQTLPSYETCIALSEKYYNEGDYTDALKWAKNANIQNNKKPESWIMSAKALYKLGKKEEAVKILKIYYNYHKDEKVKKLLGEFNEGDK